MPVNFPARYIYWLMPLLALLLTACPGTTPGGFTLSLSPDSVVLAPSQNAQITVGVQRTGGYTGDVDITANDLPTGVQAAPLKIPSGQDSGQLTLTAAANAPLAGAKAVTVTGTGTPASVTASKTLNVSVGVAAGGPDGTFGTGGKVNPDPAGVPTGFTLEDIAATAVQPDGKVLVAGSVTSSDGSNNNVIVMRFDASGALDTGFSGDGVEVTDFGRKDYATAIAVAPDGKVVVAGSSYASTAGTPSQVLLARYTSAGVPDAAFDGDGKLTLNVGVGSNDAEAAGVTVLADGSVVAAVSAVVQGSRFGLALVKRTSAGAADGGFGSGGVKLTSELAQEASATALAQAGAGFVVVGEALGQWVVARYTATGALDTAFSGDGLLTETAPGGYNLLTAKGVAVQSDGKVVVVGSASNASGPNGLDFALARYNANGTPDIAVRANDLSGGGSRDDEARGVAIDSQGRIVAAGYSTGAARSVLTFARYTPTGVLDAAFDGNGTADLDFGAAFTAVPALGLTADGKMVAGGYTRTVTDPLLPAVLRVALGRVWQ